MARLRSRKDLASFQQKHALLNDPRTPYGLAVSLRTGGGAARKGYLNTLNRQRKKTGGQLKGLPGCGQNVKDWMRGY
jgi:hypothetical protein